MRQRSIRMRYNSCGSSPCSFWLAGGNGDAANSLIIRRTRWRRLAGSALISATASGTIKTSTYSIELVPYIFPAMPTCACAIATSRFKLSICCASNRDVFYRFDPINQSVPLLGIENGKPLVADGHKLYRLQCLKSGHGCTCACMRCSHLL